VPRLPLSTDVVSGVHGAMVRQSTGSDTAGDLAELSMSMSHLPLTVLHAGCVPRHLIAQWLAYTQWLAQRKQAPGFCHNYIKY